jgi:hypothetical protein
MLWRLWRLFRQVSLRGYSIPPVSKVGEKSFTTFTRKLNEALEYYTSVGVLGRFIWSSHIILSMITPGCLQWVL